MTTLLTRPNHTGTQYRVCHTLNIPPCCPVSGNPLGGSYVKIIYRPRGLVLDVMPLPSYIKQFVGGLRGASDTIEIRDMEAMIQRIADDCSSALDVPVRVYADLVLWPHSQRMHLRVTSR